MGAYLSSPITDKENATGESHFFSYAISSHQGWRRTQEDAHIAQKLTEEHFLFGVLDGHGGAEVAQFCARFLPEELKKHEHFQNGAHEQSLVAVFHRMDELMQSDDGRTHLESLRPRPEPDQAQDDALAVLRKYMAMQKSQEDAAAAAPEAANPQDNNGSIPPFSVPSDEESQAGCTAVVALVTKENIYVANAGDSRAVLSRGKKALPLSCDHKPNAACERERIVAAGGFLSEIGGICRVNGNLSLSRAIGDLRYKQNPDLDPAAQIITAQPDVMKIDLSAEDEFLVLACDGIWDVMESQQVVDFVHERMNEGKPPAVIADELLDACVAADPRESRGKGCDNMTACIVVFKGNSAGSAAVNGSTGEAMEQE